MSFERMTIDERAPPGKSGTVEFFKSVENCAKVRSA
jgi:hypothetical protein